MRKWLKKVKDAVASRHIMLSILLVNNAVCIAVTLLFYPILPALLNYPPGTINTKFDVEVSTICYLWQYIIVITLIIILGSIFLVVLLKDIDKWRELKESKTNEGIIKLKKIRNQCLNIPYIIYVTFIFTATFAVIMVFLILGFSNISDLKIVIAIFSGSILAATISHIFSKRILTTVLLNTYDIKNSKAGIRIGIKGKIFLQIIPMLLASVLFTSLIGYSRLIKEKGDLLFESYKLQLDNIFKQTNSQNDITKKLSEIELKNNNDFVFIIRPDGLIKTSNGSGLSDFFKKYIRDLSMQYNGHVYDYYGIDAQGAIERLKVQGKEWIVGVRYEVSSSDTIMNFTITCLILIIISLAVLWYFSKVISDDVSLVAKSLIDISEGGNVNVKKHLIATSNDEIGDLVIAFNKIQDLTSENIEKITQTQKQLTERERLASLGELAGGVAHDINSPLSAIQGSTSFIKKLFLKYFNVSDIKEIPPEIYQQKSNEILEQIENTLNACGKIVNIVNSVRNHTRNLSGDNIQEFYVSNLVDDIKTLLNHQLKQSGCQLICEEKEPYLINGDIGKLGQVLTNLIMNAIQAYNGKSGKIEVKVRKKINNIIIEVADNAGGISQRYREGIFKSILTTKGTQGTGLGLYLSYSIITGHFGGEMWFTSKEGTGTTFFISIPIDDNKNK